MDQCIIYVFKYSISISRLTFVSPKFIYKLFLITHPLLIYFGIFRKLREMECSLILFCFSYKETFPRPKVKILWEKKTLWICISNVKLWYAHNWMPSIAFNYRWTLFPFQFSLVGRTAHGTIKGDDGHCPFSDKRQFFIHNSFCPLPFWSQILEPWSGPEPR